MYISGKIGDRCMGNPASRYGIGSISCRTGMPNTHCSFEGEHITGRRCRCNFGPFWPKSDLSGCYVRETLGEPCNMPSNVNDCQWIVENSICVDGRCICDEGYRETEDGKQCVPRVINDRCIADVDCKLIRNATCSSGCPSCSCACKTGYVSADDGKRCLARKIGDACDNHLDCIAVIVNSQCQFVSDCDVANDATCVRSVCECKRGYTHYNFNAHDPCSKPGKVH